MLHNSSSSLVHLPSSVPSFLNNDGIDALKPAVRKHRVSSLSVSDMAQWHAEAQGITRGSSSDFRSSHRTDSLLNLSRNTSLIRRRRRQVIDHPRVASYAFAFDIDGVIVKGPETIPEAKQALRMLDGDNPYNIRVPYIFVTNGGGRSEKARSLELSARLETPIAKEQVIQGHTPMKELVKVHLHVLVVGGVGDACKQVALEYGFKNVYTPLDILKWNPSVSPYHTLTAEEEAVAVAHDFSQISIEAILVFADSRNWASDQQIILELLMSQKGVMGTTAPAFDQGPGIFFAHSDFVWATNYGLNRYGMGALQVSLAAIFREHTGRELTVTRFGKPQRGTFSYANKVLTSHRQEILDRHVSLKTNPVFSDSESDDDCLNFLTVTLAIPPASTVYFVGDTPESDIRFANSHDASWHSILVNTGVYEAGTVPKYEPKHTCETVLDAVKYAIEREHQMELQEWNEGAAAPSTGATTPASIRDEAECGETVDVPVMLTDQIAAIKLMK